MCGRYRLSRRKQIIEEHFDSVSGDEDWSPRYNIAPTQPIPVIRQHPKEPVRELSVVHRGAKNSSIAVIRVNGIRIVEGREVMSALTEQLKGTVKKLG
jgi:putative SOS response-associated peptidase YedK